MADPTSRNAILVVEASVLHEDPGEIVESNVSSVNALLEEYLSIDEVAVDAIRSYYVDYYLAQVNNGGFAQFVYNSGWSPVVIQRIREGLQAMGARQHLEVFEFGAKLVEGLGQGRLDEFFAIEHMGDKAGRDALNVLDDKFSAAEEIESLVARNAAWLRAHPDLCPLPCEEDIRSEARRRGQALPDRERRAADALANEPRYMKLIRALCSQSGHKLDRVTAGDHTRVYEGESCIAWHFLTDKGHYHMLEAGGRALMFRGHSTTDRVCVVEASDV